MATPQRGDDFLGTLSQAIDRLRAAGFKEDAAMLWDLAFEAAWTSSSEMVGESGLAILRVQQRARGKLPKPVARGLDLCMDHVREVWPDIRLR